MAEDRVEQQRRYRAAKTPAIRRANSVRTARYAAALRVALAHPDEFEAAIIEEEQKRMVPTATRNARPRKTSA